MPRKRDVRRQRLEHNRERWPQAWAPIEDDPEGDEAWRDAIAEANSGSEQLEKLNHDEARKRRAG